MNPFGQARARIDPAVRESIESFMQQCGQISLRLFSAPHPKTLSPAVQPVGSPVTLQGAFEFTLTKAGFDSRTDSAIVFYTVTETNAVCRLKYHLTALKGTKEPLFAIEPFTSLAIFGRVLISGSANGQVLVTNFLTHDQSRFSLTSGASITEQRTIGPWSRGVLIHHQTYIPRKDRTYVSLQCPLTVVR
jgi:hypothetical protein